MIFKYRYVGFGTVFAGAKGGRKGVVSAKENEAVAAKDESTLFDNELVVDVGGICWGYRGEPLCILDHHFPRPEGDQFPSASAAVLHCAPLIKQQFSDPNGTIWLVTHRDPDFDAFCALFLARRILEGRLPATGWEDLGLQPTGWGGTSKEINWRNPSLPNDSECRVALLLAAHAAAVDNGWRISCPRERALHSILYAAVYVRRRNYLADGAQQFFEAASQAIAQGLNPLFNSVLERSSTFSPELELLSREMPAYHRDLLRARKAVVHLATFEEAFQNWFEMMRCAPLLDLDLKLISPHAVDKDTKREQADGIFIRDPESLLFKEWARGDLDNSPLGQGFIFTAVAYSGLRVGAPFNTTDYYFSVDAEKARGRHLYEVWAVLQRAEIEALHRKEWSHLREKLEDADRSAAATHRRTTCRIGFEQRAGGLAGLFHDPWFDGSNWKCSIVATPNGGTLIGRPGMKSDLTDDPVADLVARQLEFAIYVSPLILESCGTSAGHNKQLAQLDLLEPGPGEKIPPFTEGGYRFGSVQLHSNAELGRGTLAEEIGKVLWRVLNSDDRGGFPTDFLERHLMVHSSWVGVWSRRGIAVAFRPEAQQTVDGFRSILKELALLAANVEKVVEGRIDSAEDGPPLSVQALIKQVTRIKHRLASPGSRLPHRFFEATGMGQVLESLRDIQATENLATITHVQKMVEYVEVLLVAAYTVSVTYYVGHGFGFPGQYIGWWILGNSCLAAVFTTLLFRPHGGQKKGLRRLLLVAVLVSGLVVSYIWVGLWLAKSPTELNRGEPSPRTLTR
ncbi:MAG: hypothetical protein AB9869_08125 [Verrucomicrobiia bacterium]